MVPLATSGLGDRQPTRCSTRSLFEEKFYKGFSAAEGTKLLAALRHLESRASKTGARDLPRTERSLKVWHKIAPQTQRLPCPWIALMAVVGLALYHGYLPVSLNLLAQFRTYLRHLETRRMRQSS